MKSENINNKMLARYLAGGCSPKEQQDVEAWADSDPENAKKLAKFKQIWKMSGQNQSALEEYVDVDAEWEQLQARLQREGEFEIPSKSKSLKEKYRTASIHSMTQKFMRVAAIFVIAGLMGVLAYQNWYQAEPEPQEPALREVSTANAQRVNMTLGDGTTVKLNAGSVMKFPNQFESDVREIFLKGEAYFDVTSNPDRPFVIHSRGSVIRVLGTSFTVRSYEEDHQVRVVVEEGRVSFSPQMENAQDAAMLTANELGRYTLDTNRIETAQVDDMQLYLSWREGYLKFREEPMSNVAESLERRYGVQVRFKGEAISQKTLTAFLKSRSIRSVLDVIAMSLDVEYQLEDNIVTFQQN